MPFPIPTLSAATCPGETLENALAQLSSSTVFVHRKGHVLYKPSDAATSLFLVQHGHIKVSRSVRTNTQVIIDLHGPGEFFGESALLGGCRSEVATVMQDARVLAWPVSAIEDFLVVNPQFSLTLLQKLIRKLHEFTDRIESLGGETIPRRLARVLLRCGDRFGARTDDGSVELPPLTHVLLSEYVVSFR